MHVMIEDHISFDCYLVSYYVIDILPLSEVAIPKPGFSGSHHMKLDSQRHQCIQH